MELTSFNLSCRVCAILFETRYNINTYYQGVKIENEFIEFDTLMFLLLLNTSRSSKVKPRLGIPPGSKRKRQGKSLMFGKSTIPEEYELDDVRVMLRRCGEDPALMKFLSNVLVAAGYWHKKANLYLMMQRMYFLFGWMVCYFLTGKS